MRLGWKGFVISFPHEQMQISRRIKRPSPIGNHLRSLNDEILTVEAGIKIGCEHEK